MFTQEQHDILLRGINASRIEHRKQAGMNLSYLSQHDVRAHLIRIFGFAGFDLTTVEAKLAFEDNDGGKWNVGYQVTMELIIKNEYGHPVARYSETAVGTSTQGRRGEAHDMAMKTASSDAMKRCAINLGDQFGLSLYDNGATNPIVRATLVGPSASPNVAAASVEATIRPVSAELDEPAQEDTPAPTTPPEALEAVAELASYVPLDSKTRIMNVAKFKTRNKDLLQHTVDIDGQEVTIARYADLVASGKYNEENTNE